MTSLVENEQFMNGDGASGDEEKAEKTWALVEHCVRRHPRASDTKR